MNLASVINRQADTEKADKRAGLSSMLRRICADIGAECYLLIEPSTERGAQGLRLIAANWTYDALDELGADAISKII